MRERFRQVSRFFVKLLQPELSAWLVLLALDWFTKWGFEVICSKSFDSLCRIDRTLYKHLIIQIKDGWMKNKSPLWYHGSCEVQNLHVHILCSSANKNTKWLRINVIHNNVSDNNNNRRSMIMMRQWPKVSDLIFIEYLGAIRWALPMQHLEAFD